MSGGSGGYYGNVTSTEVQEQIAQTTEDLAKLFQPELQRLLDKVLPEINDRDVARTNEIRDRVKEAVSQELDATLIGIAFAGSISKETYVAGLSDIDTLAFFRGLNVKNVTPLEIKSQIATALERRLTDASVTTGNVAVTAKFPDGMEFQVIPAVREGAKVRVPSWDGSSWSKIDVRNFRRALSNLNENLSGKLIPTIKLAKRIISGLPKNAQLSGYHVEALAIKAFRECKSIEPKTSAMLPAFFELGSKAVLSPIRDSSNQSIHVDEYLGPKNSVARREVSHLFERLSKRMKNVSAVRSLGRWREILGMPSE